MFKKGIILIGLIAINATQAANTLTVGSDDQCGYPTIQAALSFAAPGDFISVAEGIIIGLDAQVEINKSIILTGGLDSTCQVFTINHTSLQSDLAGAVISVDVSGGANVEINGFDISGSQADAFNPFTSGIAISGDGTVTIDNTLIHDNKSALGGGISAINGSVLFLQNNTEIYANEASSKGGGIYCLDCTLFATDIKIGKFDNNQELGNTVTNMDGLGGGIYMENAPTSFLGKSPNGTGVVTVSYNSSIEAAGIYLKDSSLISNHPSNIFSYNQADNLAAVATLEGNSFFNIVNGKILNNSGSNIFTTIDTSELIIESDNDGCHLEICAEISNNIAVSSLFRIQGQANVTIKRVKSDRNSNRFAFVNGSLNNGITVENSIISNQEVAILHSLIKVVGSLSPLAKFTNVTVVNNSGAVIFDPSVSAKLIFDGGIISGNTAAALSELTNIDNLEVKNSVIQYDPTGLVNTVQADPLFVDLANDNYYLQFTSPAIDYFTGTTTEDILGVSRPQGLSHDAGAYEWSDLIFANDFELVIE